MHIKLPSVVHTYATCFERTVYDKITIKFKRKVKNRDKKHQNFSNKNPKSSVTRRGLKLDIGLIIEWRFSLEGVPLPICREIMVPLSVAFRERERALSI